MLVAAGCAATTPAADTTPAEPPLSFGDHHDEEQPLRRRHVAPAGKASPDAASRCRAQSLRLRGGRQGESGGAHADIKLTNTSSTACTLAGLPRVSILRAEGTALPIRHESTGPPPELQPVTLTAHGGTAWLTVYWSNWCHDSPGPLKIAVILPDAAGTVRGPFNGPPDYDLVPACLAPGKWSTVQVIQAYGRHI